MSPNVLVKLKDLTTAYGKIAACSQRRQLYQVFFAHFYPALVVKDSYLALRQEKSAVKHCLMPHGIAKVLIGAV